MEKLAAYAFLACCLVLSAFVLVKGIADGAQNGEISAAADGNGILFGMREGRTGFAAFGNECSEGEMRNCAIGTKECEGTRYCIAGKYGECIPNQKMCEPGKILPCSLNSCQFGESVCNSCGSAWGKCVMKGSARKDADAAKAGDLGREAGKMGQGADDSVQGGGNSNISCDAANITG